MKPVHIQVGISEEDSKGRKVMQYGAVGMFSRLNKGHNVQNIKVNNFLNNAYGERPSPKHILLKSISYKIFKYL
jgi:hypothetical protein